MKQKKRIKTKLETNEFKEKQKKQKKILKKN